MTKARAAILSSIQLAGVLTIAVMAPKVLSAFSGSSKRRREGFHGALTRLADKGLISMTNGSIRLTQKGEVFLRKSALNVNRPKKWDGKWRIVIFDIAESRKAKRNALRGMLIQIGFLRLQNSVWVYPFDCEELITLLRTDYRLGREVLYMIVDKLERDRSLRAHFSLTK